MAFDRSIFRRHLAKMVGDLPVTFSFSGTACTGTLAQRTTTDDLQEGGYVIDYDLVLHVPLQVQTNGTWAATFASQPGLGDSVTISGTSHRVVKLDHSQDGLELVLGLKGVNR